LNVQKGCLVSALVVTRFIIDHATPQVDAIIPWRPEDILENAAGNKTNYRKIPMGLIASTDNQTVVDKEAIRLVCMYVCICGFTDKFKECCSVDEDRDSIKNNNFDIC
jgi:hypothetical protein